MDDDTRRYAEIIKAKQARLHQLDKQAATMGLDTPPHFEMERQTLQEELSAMMHLVFLDAEQELESRLGRWIDRRRKIHHGGKLGRGQRFESSGKVLAVVFERPHDLVARLQFLLVRSGFRAERVSFAEALDIVSEGEHCRVLLHILPPYADFLRARGRVDEAAELDARLAQRVPTAA